MEQSDSFSRSTTKLFHHINARKSWKCFKLMMSLCFLLIFVDAAEAQNSGWVAKKTDTGATATDCSNCDENIGVLITCQRGDPKREIHLMSLEQRDGSLAGKPAIVSAKSDSKILALSGEFSQPGEAGPYPVLKLNQDDPFFEFLSHAGYVVFSANGTSSKIELKDSRSALRKMNSGCSR